MASQNVLGTQHGELHRGARIGKYEIVTQLSIGGMAELFLVFTVAPGGMRRFFVVKRILPDARSNENFVKMFLDEARITASLNHPNIAQVYELGESGGPFISMEFIAGQNLNQITKECIKQRRGFPIGFSTAVCRDVCRALHHAHSQNDSSGRASPIIHRDVAQKNVMVTYDGAVKLLDFGIAKARGSLGRTNAGMVKGTTGYMSPEQVRGEELDGRSDLFAVGVMLHELLTGKRLFAAATETEEMERILWADIPAPVELNPKVPAKLSSVVMRALERNRERRPATAQAFATDLERSCGRLFYDIDRTSAFMKELFSSRMRATQALLDSAGGLESAGTRAAQQELQDDVGMVFPEGAATDAPDTDGGRETAPSLLLSPGVSSRRFLGPVLALSGIALLSLGTVLRITRKPTEPDAPLRSFDAQSAGVEQLVGNVTIGTDPGVKVYEGEHFLGETPARFQMRTGLHRLRLLDSQGRFHILDVSVRKDNETKISGPLSEIPLEEM